MYGKIGYCMNHGHDWALQDANTFMVKICLRCGAEQYFFPEECDYGPDMDDHSTKDRDE